MPPLGQAPEIAAHHGLSINKNQGNYCRGKAYDITVKLVVPEAIKSQGESLNLSALWLNNVVSQEATCVKCWGKWFAIMGMSLIQKGSTKQEQL